MLALRPSMISLNTKDVSPLHEAIAPSPTFRRPISPFAGLPRSVEIDCSVYGRQTITEPELIALILSPAVQRLKHVLQHGITAVIGMCNTEPVTRFQHSVGAMILVRLQGADIETQAAALLHDIGHTALSHVADSVFGYVVHEDDKYEYLSKTTLPQLLVDIFGKEKSEHILEEVNYSLVERDAPKLCADRTDYGLRDTIAFSLLTKEVVGQILNDIVAFNGELCMQTVSLAKVFALAYMECDQKAWANELHSVLYDFAAQTISLALERGQLVKADLWRYSDHDFWALFSESTDSEVRKMASRVRPDVTVEGVPLDTPLGGSADSELGLIVEKKFKTRTIDPDIVFKNELGVIIGSKKLSELDADYAKVRQEYIDSKKFPLRFRVRLPSL